REHRQIYCFRGSVTLSTSSKFLDPFLLSLGLEHRTSQHFLETKFFTLSIWVRKTLGRIKRSPEGRSIADPKASDRERERVGRQRSARGWHRQSIAPLPHHVAISARIICPELYLRLCIVYEWHV